MSGKLLYHGFGIRAGQSIVGQMVQLLRDIAGGKGLRVEVDDF